MAARRLIIVLLALMGISTIAAILAPPIEERSSDTASESTTSTESGDRRGGGDPEAAGVAVEQRIGAFEQAAVLGGVVGDRLELTITSPRPTNVQIPALGLSGFADSGAPVRFDIFLREQARYVVERDDGTMIARIEVTAPVEPSDGGDAKQTKDGKGAPDGSKKT